MPLFIKRSERQAVIRRKIHAMHSPMEVGKMPHFNDSAFLAFKILVSDDLCSHMNGDDRCAAPIFLYENLYLGPAWQ